VRFVRAEAAGALAAAKPAPAIRATAPAGLGRVNVSFAAPAPMKPAGELVRLVFAAQGAAGGALAIRMEALSMIDAAGRLVSARLPPPVSVALSRAN